MNDVISRTMVLEGGYVDRPDDSGGPTCYGITQEVARDNGYAGPMSEIPWDTAERIYAARYWEPIRGADLYKLAPAVSYEVFDTAVNTGVRRAGTFLQRSLDVLGAEHVKADGRVGDLTLEALTRYLAARSEDTLVLAMNCLQGAFYIELAERREKDKAFIYGWLKHRVKM